jgi:hypothetical protein
LGASVDAIKKHLDAAPKSIVVGVLAGTGTYADTGATVPEVAFWNEFGTEDIPPRPFLVPSLRKNTAKYAKIIEAMLVKTMKGESSDLSLLGITAASDVQDGIYAVWTPDNKESTKERKRKKWAKGGSAQTVKPLIDTGRMVQSIKWAKD